MIGASVTNVGTSSSDLKKRGSEKLNTAKEPRIKCREEEMLSQLKNLFVFLPE